MGNPEPPEALRAADALLERRRNPKWVSLSWLTSRPLISSVNQLLIGASPTLVPRLRDYWAERLGGPTDERVVDQSTATSFLLLGDPGEQDRSQYIVVPAVREVVRREQPAFGVICSDVIYPSGDVNDYVHGFYLPYGPTPPGDATRPTGAEAVTGSSGTTGPETTGSEATGAPGTGEAGPISLDRLPLFAIPGNHDWHDGLSGFMQHFCGTGPLERDQFGWPQEVAAGSAQWLEGIRRMLVRRPDSFIPQPLWRGRPDEPLTHGLTRDLTLTEFRALRGPRPAQPGSYFAVRMRDLLVVAIDTGIGTGGGDSAIDNHQGRWLQQVSAMPGPKVLLTGNPLLVNAEWHRCVIEAPLPGASGEVARYATVNEIVDDPANGYVAVIGGDIHNFQHYVVQRPQPAPHQGSRAIHHVVSGGAGAYMSATHPVRVVQQIRRRTPGPDPADLPDSMSPTAVASLRHFTRLLLPRLWRLERAMLAGLIGLLVGSGVVAAAPSSVGPMLGWLALALTALALLRIALPSQWLRHDDFPLAAYRAALVATTGLAGAEVALAVAWLTPASGPGEESAGESGLRTLAAWAALTVGGCLLAWLTRRSGWWRDPSWPHEQVSALTRGLVLGVGTAGVVVAGWLGRRAVEGVRLPPMVAGLPASALWAVPGVVVGIVMLAGVASFVWIRPSRPGGRLWGTWAPTASYLVQATGALLILTYVVFPQRPSLPWAVVCGVLLVPLTVGVGLGIAVLGLRLACLPAGANWARRWGELGHWGQRGAGAAVVVVLGLQLPVSREGTASALIRGVMALPGVIALAVAVLVLVVWLRARRATARAGTSPPVIVAGLLSVVVGLSQVLFAARLDPPLLLSTFRAELGTQLTLATLLLVALVIDALRRGQRGAAGYKPWALVVVLGVLLAVWGIDRWLGWVVRSAVASAAVIILVLSLLVLVHLTYLGAYSLITDQTAHHDGRELLTPEQARTFLDWRVDPRRRPQLPPVQQRRAKIVFPSTDKPQGPIQRYVAEIFDSDSPPFWKNFLLLRTEPDRLLIQVHLVSGDGTIAADAQPKMSIVVPLVTW
ncbi:MAG: hypothetical protein U0Q19_20910 [Kineosporiaceae bacterium]